MFVYEQDSLEKVEKVLKLLKPHQIDMAYWRKTKVGLAFSETVACIGGWTCLMGYFGLDGLKLIATDPMSEFGYVPALHVKHHGIIRGYKALGYCLQQNASLDTAERYGRNIFALPGGGEFDKHLPTPFDAKHMVSQRITYAKSVHIQRNEVVLD